MTAAADVWVVDTNVVVAGLLTQDTDSPPAQVLDAMLDDRMRFLLCVELLAEYRRVLLRQRVRRRHGLDEDGIDCLLEALVTNAVIVDISERAETAPDPGDDHLWRMLAARTHAGLITGDAVLLKNPQAGTHVLTPRAFVTL